MQLYKKTKESTRKDLDEKVKIFHVHEGQTKSVKELYEEIERLKDEIQEWRSKLRLSKRREKGQWKIWLNELLGADKKIIPSVLPDKLKSFLRPETSVAVIRLWKELLYKAVDDWAPEVELRFVCMVVWKGKRTLLITDPCLFSIYNHSVSDLPGYSSPLGYVGLIRSLTTASREKKLISSSLFHFANFVVHLRSEIYTYQVSRS